MKTYKEQIKNKTNCVLLKDRIVLGTFGSLKKIVNFVSSDEFPSYWTLIRKKDNPIVCGNYSIFRVKHY